MRGSTRVAVATECTVTGAMAEIKPCVGQAAAAVVNIILGALRTTGTRVVAVMTGIRVVVVMLRSSLAASANVLLLCNFLSTFWNKGRNSKDLHNKWCGDVPAYAHLTFDSIQSPRSRIQWVCTNTVR